MFMDGFNTTKTEHGFKIHSSDTQKSAHQPVYILEMDIKNKINCTPPPWSLT